MNIVNKYLLLSILLGITSSMTIPMEKKVSPFGIEKDENLAQLKDAINNENIIKANDLALNNPELLNKLSVRMLYNLKQLAAKDFSKGNNQFLPLLQAIEDKRVITAPTHQPVYFERTRDEDGVLDVSFGDFFPIPEERSESDE